MLAAEGLGHRARRACRAQGRLSVLPPVPLIRAAPCGGARVRRRQGSGRGVQWRSRERTTLLSHELYCMGCAFLRSCQRMRACPQGAHSCMLQLASGWCVQTCERLHARQDVHAHTCVYICVQGRVRVRTRACTCTHGRMCTWCAPACTCTWCAPACTCTVYRVCVSVPCRPPTCPSRRAGGCAAEPSRAPWGAACWSAGGGWHPMARCPGWACLPRCCPPPSLRPGGRQTGSFFHLLVCLLVKRM